MQKLVYFTCLLVDHEECFYSKMSLTWLLVFYTVALARMLFPREAKVAMEIAQVDGTLEFTLGSSADFHAGNQRTAVDLNDTPFEIKEEHLARMKALSKTGAHPCPVFLSIDSPLRPKFQT